VTQRSSVALAEWTEEHGLKLKLSNQSPMQNRLSKDSIMGERRKAQQNTSLEALEIHRTFIDRFDPIATSNRQSNLVSNLSIKQQSSIKTYTARISILSTLRSNRSQ
jgi:hypothetical protein